MSYAETSRVSTNLAPPQPLHIDILPSNIRAISHVSETIAFVCSVLLNCLLAATLVREHNKILRPYARVLLQNCVFDLLYTCAGFASGLDIEFYQGEFMVINGGFYENWSTGWHYFGWASYLFSMLMSMYVIPIVFYFRYSIMVRKVSVSSRRLVKILVLLILYSTTVTCIVTYDMMSNDHGALRHCRKSLVDSMWWQDGVQTIDNCIIGNLKSPVFIVHCLLLGVGNMVMLSTMFYCTRAVFAALRAARPQLLEKTAKLHSQMNMLLVVQLIAPIVFVAAPACLSVATLLLQIVVPGVGILVLIGLSLIPLINPLIAILLISSYRRKAVQIIGAPFMCAYRRLTGGSILQWRIGVTSSSNKNNNKTISNIQNMA